MDKSLNFSVPLFPYLYDGDNNMSLYMYITVRIYQQE